MESDKVKQLVRQLKANAAKQESLEDELHAMDDRIHKLETVYLQGGGNIITGFDKERDRDTSHSASHTRGSSTAPHMEDSGRIFSLSNAAFIRQEKK